MAESPAEPGQGNMFLGTVFNILLFGIIAAQVYIYYTTYRRDKLFIKIYVFVLLLANAFNSVFDALYIYQCLVLHFGDEKFLTVSNWEFGTEPALTGIIALMVQLFFAWRIHVLTRNRILVIIVVTLAVASATCSMVVAWWITARVPQFTRFQEIKAVDIGWLGCSATADITISTILRKHKTGFKETDLVIDRIIRMTAQTGLLTSVVAILDLSLYLVKSPGPHFIFNFSLNKVYTISFISSLNARKGWLPDNVTRDNVFNASNGQSHDHHDNLTSFSQDHDGTSSGQSTEKKQSVAVDEPIIPRNSPKTEVFVHVESHELRELAGGSRRRDFQTENKAHVAQAQARDNRTLSSSDTPCDHNGSVV